MVISQRGPFDREALGSEESLQRLDRAELARVVISVNCLPAALPVYVHVGERHVLIASDEAAVIEAANRGDVLAVQVDGTEPDGAIWSVQVTGMAHVPVVADALASDAARSRLLGSLEAGATLVAIPITMVVGERVRWLTST